MPETVSALDLVRSEVRSIQSTAEVAGQGFQARLLANESSFNPAFLLRQLLGDPNSLEPNRYWLPEVSTPLLDSLSTYVGLPSDHILLGNGADELILSTLLTFVRPGDSIVMAWPSYPMYPYLTQMLGMNTIKVPLCADFSLDTEALLDAARENRSPVIILANPNNPTGNLFDPGAIARLLKDSNSMVVVDEAYFEYCQQSVQHLIGKCDRLIIWRTFSKAFSLAGMRIGYLLAQPQVVAELYKTRLPFDISNLSQWMARAVLGQRAVFQNHVQVTIAERERVRRQMLEIPGVTVFPSVTNFLLFKTGLPTQLVYEGLRDRSVLIRQVEQASPLLTGCLRVSIGSPAENDLFIRALRQTISSP
ncbi:MAG: histidinol-phosphate transaminase [Bacillota bacterium]